MLLVIGTLSVVFSQSDMVNIGTILTLKSINGRVASIAMKTAVDDINSDPSILPGKKLNLTFHDANFSGFLSIIGGNFAPL